MNKALLTLASLLTIGLIFSGVIFYLNISMNTATPESSQTQAQGKTLAATTEAESVKSASASGFLKTGTLVNFDPVNMMETDTWALVYEKSDGESITIPLVLTDQTQCLQKDIQTICRPQSFSNGDRVTIDGLYHGNTIEVFNMYLPALEGTVLNWNSAKTYITSCKVRKISQTPDKRVSLTLTDKTIITTIEPEIDDVLTAVSSARSTCGEVE